MPSKKVVLPLEGAGDEPLNVTPPDSESSTVTLNAVSSPEFVIVIVYVRDVPGVTGSDESVLVTVSNGNPITNVVVLLVSFVELPSDVVALTTYELFSVEPLTSDVLVLTVMLTKND